MTEFAGYTLSGTVFIAFALKWGLDATVDPPAFDPYTMESDGWSRSRNCRKTARRRRCVCKLKHWPLEGLTRIFFAVLGAGISLYVAYTDGEPKFISHILYATVYLFFALSGLVDLLVLYCPYTMPLGLEKFTLAMAFLVEGLMLNFQLSHQTFIERNVHLLLICAIYACSCTCLAECVMSWSRLVRFARALFALLHGSWFIQAGFILYNPLSTSPVWSNSTEDYQNATLWIAVTFAWHCAGSLTILLILMALSRKRKPPLPPVEPFEVQSTHSLPQCRFSSLSNYADMKV